MPSTLGATRPELSHKTYSSTPGLERAGQRLKKAICFQVRPSLGNMTRTLMRVECTKNVSDQILNSLLNCFSHLSHLISPTDTTIAPSFIKSILILPTEDLLPHSIEVIPFNRTIKTLKNKKICSFPGCVDFEWQSKMALSLSSVDDVRETNPFVCVLVNKFLELIIYLLRTFSMVIA
ncbi:hypothetical protein GOBAR_AA12776 [Gossypium barbadense]|uniref:Uncharacterized protein n=1 Tax=Gossypium barbadense TaxID=3634 RepID=A0A2P5XX32_GOSBA|nr:hypothetical protein GOBAR_AA12776 [Gossypium barbadense]